MPCAPAFLLPDKPLLSGWLPFKISNVEILERAGRSLPVAGQSMLHRLLQEIIRTLNEGGQIPHYAPICALPGFLNEIRTRIAELKRALVAPQRLAEVAQTQADPGLIDLSRIYTEYQARLQDLGWTDLEGLGEYALEALISDEKLLTDISLLVVDGFDNFNPAQLHLLETAARRAAETWITLPGTPAMDRAAHRRFAPVAKSLAASQLVDVQTRTTSPHLPPTLRQVEANLFETTCSKNWVRQRPAAHRSPFAGRGSARSPALAQSPHRAGRPGAGWLRGGRARPGSLPISASGCGG